MVKNCSRCNYIYGQNVQICPQCGQRETEKKVSTRPLPAYRAPTPAPRQDQKDVSEHPLKIEIDYLSKRVEKLSKETHAFKEETQKFSKKKDKLVDEVGALMWQRYKGKFVFWMSLIIWTHIIVLFTGYFALNVHLNYERKIDEKVASNFQDISAEEMLKDVINSASDVLIQNDLKPLVIEIQRKMTEQGDKFMGEQRELQKRYIEQLRSKESAAKPREPSRNDKDRVYVQKLEDYMGDPEKVTPSEDTVNQSEPALPADTPK